ncbi:MAG TPA: hypothetical protein VM681_03125 [Candidatus Thermoplasmatota archaeon]|nr:hypothetical protein [Candidatus Thermoplasmatota archaeon]
MTALIMAVPPATADIYDGEFNDDRLTVGLFYFNPASQVEHRQGDFGTGYYDRTWTDMHGDANYKPQCGENAPPDCRNRVQEDCNKPAQPGEADCRAAWNCLIVLGAVRPTAFFFRTGWLQVHDEGSDNFGGNADIDMGPDCPTPDRRTGNGNLGQPRNGRVREADERPMEEGGCCDKYSIYVEDQWVDRYSMATGGFEWGNIGERPFDYQYTAYPAENRTGAWTVNGVAELSVTVAVGSKPTQVEVCVPAADPNDPDVCALYDLFVPSEDALANDPDYECDVTDPGVVSGSEGRPVGTPGTHPDPECLAVMEAVFETYESSITLIRLSGYDFVLCNGASYDGTGSCELDNVVQTTETVDITSAFCWDEDFAKGCGGNQNFRHFPGSSWTSWSGLRATVLEDANASPGLYLVCANIVEGDTVPAGAGVRLISDYTWLWFQDASLSHAAELANPLAYDAATEELNGVDGRCGA